MLFCKESIMSTTGYAQLVTEAEEAVKNVKNAKLKQLAFQKILDVMLAPSARTGLDAIEQNSRIRNETIPRLEKLISEGFFKSPRTLTEARVEMANRGDRTHIEDLGELM